MGFAPIVKVSEQADFESFAYDYFDSRPDFPNTTGINPFGKGIWRMTKNKTRIHDNDAVTEERQILTPIIQCCIDNPGDRILLFNLYSEPSRRKTIDGIIKCSEKIRQETQAAANAETADEAQENMKNSMLQATATTKHIHSVTEHIHPSATTEDEVEVAPKTRSSSNRDHHSNHDTNTNIINKDEIPIAATTNPYPDYACG